MTPFGWILSFTLLGGVASALVAGLFLLLPEGPRTRSLPFLVAFATGALLGAALQALQLPPTLTGLVVGSVVGTLVYGLAMAGLFWPELRRFVAETRTVS